MTEGVVAATLPPKARKRAVGSLYSYNKVYPKAVAGTFRRLTWEADALLLAIYFAGPWLRWDRGSGVPDQAVLLDMVGRRGYFFNIEIWPQEVYYFTGLLMMGAIGLFLATALLGRVYCGFTCIHTVFTDVFLLIERLIEGDRAKRMRDDEGAWTVGRIGRKAVKNALWLTVATLTSWSWLLYFNEAHATTRAFLNGAATPSLYGFLGLFAFFTWLLAGFAREQVCIYMCPWPRFQSAMTDEDSLIVTYEAWRGEPRGPAHGQSFAGRGHCVDCTLCYQVCPTGTDIRAGSQLSCIGCGLCIDACNPVMDRLGLPHGLISYDSVFNRNAHAAMTPTRIRLLRPRTMIYAALLAAVVAVMATALALRKDVDISILHERNPLYVKLSGGAIRNGYTINILNKKHAERKFELALAGVDGATLRIEDYGTAPIAVPVSGDSVGTFRIYVTLPRGATSAPPLTLTLTERSGNVVKANVVKTSKLVFIGPEAAQP